MKNSGLTYYQILEIPHEANSAAIKMAYRRLSMRYHPDRPQGDSNLFQLIKQAYETLSDAQKKRRYDKSLQEEIILNPMEFVTTYWHNVTK
jgi:DnaJ-class molecular chaperone